MLIDSRIFFNFYKYKRKIYSTVKLTKSFSSSVDKLKILFFGTDNFSLPSLAALNNESKKNSNITTIGVVTSFKGPTNPIRSYAERENLPLYKWPIEPAAANKYDLGIVVSFGHLIPTKIISSLPLGMINVHASILPRWRGAAPIIYSLMHGDRTTGVTIMRVEPKHFDIGDILAQEEVEIRPDMLLPELHDVLANVGANLIVKTVRDAPKSIEKGRKQDEHLVTYAPKITPSIADIRWTEMKAQDVFNLFRSLYSYKELWTKFHNYVVKIIDLKVDNEQKNKNNNSLLYPPGYVEYCKRGKCLKVYCKDGSCVIIENVKVEGKRQMSASDFNNGFLKKLPKDDRIFQ